MREAILELLPEIQWVQDAKLREAVIQCHIDALNEGRWQPCDMDLIPFCSFLPQLPYLVSSACAGSNPNVPYGIGRIQCDLSRTR